MERRVGTAGRFVVAQEVVDLLGVEVLDYLGQFEPAGPLTCQVCGLDVPATSSEPLSVLGGLVGGSAVVSFAHEGCYPSMVIDASEVVAGERDALAWFGYRTDAAPSALMAFEGAGKAASPAGGDWVDLLVTYYLDSGFSLVTGDVAFDRFDVAPGWSLSLSSTGLVLAHEVSGMAYEQELSAEVAAWFDVASDERSCVVVTGSNLALSASPTSEGPFEVARAAGTLVAATVRVQPASPGA